MTTATTTNADPAARTLDDGRRLMRLHKTGWCRVERFDPTTLRPGRAIPAGDLYGGIGQLIDERDAEGDATGRRLVVTDVYTPDDAEGELSRRLAEGNRRFGALALDPPDPIASEVATLIDMGLNATAAMVRAARPAPEPDPATAVCGEVLADGLAPVPVDVLADLVRRHAHGDWGANGTADAVELGDDHRAVPEAFDVATRNAVALASGRGIVRSVFNDGLAVHVETFIGRGRRTTLVFAQTR